VIPPYDEWDWDAIRWCTAGGLFLLGLVLKMISMGLHH
jgi:hypothetical protein